MLHGCSQSIRRMAICTLFAFALVASPAELAQSRPESQGPETARPGSPEAYLGRGYADLKSDRYEEAVREFQAALALNPKLVFRARFPLAVALFELHQPEEAHKEFEMVRSEVGDHPDVMYYLGRVDLTEGNNRGAIKDLTEAAANPPFPDTTYYLGTAFLKNKEYGPAEKWLRAAAKTAPRDFRVRESLGLLYQEEKRESDAQDAFKLAEEMQRRDDGVRQERISCIQKLQSASLEEARPVCEKLFEPDDVEALTMLGTIYGQHGDYAEALKPLSRAAEISPNSPQVQYNLALDCFRLKRYEEADTALSRAVKQWPDLFEPNALLGVVLYRLGQNHEAYQVLRHAHDLNPQDTETTDFLYEVSLVLAQKSHQKHQNVVSLQYLRAAAKLRPNDPGPHRLMAVIYNSVGEQEQASREQQEVSRLTAPNAAITK